MVKYNDAINICLQVIGEQTLEAGLDIDGIYEAEQADLLIETVKREVLLEGWSFNTDEEWSILPDTNGYITVPSSALRIDSSDTSSNLIRKDGKIYSKETQSYIFSASESFDIVWELDFDDLPLAAKSFIVLKAARLLYQRIVGDPNMLSILVNDEREARMKLDLHEEDINDYNIFDDTTVSRALTRNANPTGIRG